MGKSRFQIIEHQAATHSELFGHERILEGKYAGKIFYFWNSKSETKLSADFSQFNDFSVTPPIIQSASSHYNQNYVLPSKQPYVDVYRLGFDTSGYAKPYFVFLRNQFNLNLLTTEAYESALNQFQLDPNNLVSTEKFNSIGIYRDLLLKQVERQSELVFRLNQLISSVLKVYTFGLIMLDKRDFKDTDAIKRKLIHHFNYEILGGSLSKQINLEWMTSLSTEGLQEEIFQASFNGLSYLLGKRDNYLNVTLGILETLYPIEVLIENIITHERILSPSEYRKKTMVSPKMAASEMITNAKNPKYSIDSVSEAMSVVRDYIIENELTSLRGKVSLLIRLIQNNIDGISSGPSENAIRRWISFYATKAGISQS